MDHYINEYIINLPSFSKEICLQLDALIHKASPELMEGKKWEFVSYWTEKSLVCGFYAAKEFVTFTFYDGALMKDDKKLFNYGDVNAKNRSIKFSRVDDIYKNQIDLINYIKEAVENSKKGLKVKATDRIINLPKDFSQALKSANLLQKFESQNYTMKKEYIVWIEDAKKVETRSRRIEKALELLAHK